MLFVYSYQPPILQYLSLTPLELLSIPVPPKLSPLAVPFENCFSLGTVIACVRFSLTSLPLNKQQCRVELWSLFSLFRHQIQALSALLLFHVLTVTFPEEKMLCTIADLTQVSCFFRLKSKGYGYLTTIVPYLTFLFFSGNRYITEES